MEHSYWNNSGKYQSSAEVLNLSVPGSGPAETLAGELWRAAVKIYHDYNNNGFGNYWKEPATLLLDYVQLPNSVRDVFEAYGEGNVCGSNPKIGKELELMVDAVILFARDLNGTEDHPGDMWDYMTTNTYDFDQPYEYLDY